MGNNRRTKQNHGGDGGSGSDHHLHHHQTSSTISSNMAQYIRRRTPHSSEEMDLNVAMQENAGGCVSDTLGVLWNLSICVSLSTIVGLAVGMVISVHFFEIDRPLPGTKMSLEDAEFLYFGPKSSQCRVTSLDPSIAAANVIPRKVRSGHDASLELGKVITTTESGQLHVLMVVEAEDDEYFVSKYSHGGCDDDNDGNLLHGERNSTGTWGYTGVYGGSSSTKTSSSVTFPTLSQPTIIPSPCRSDKGKTIGFGNWEKLSMAISEANALSAERFMKWQQWFATNSFRAFDDDRLYYEEDVVFTICPRTRLRARGEPIYINAENIVLECDGCVISGGGTHLNFGGFAKNVLVRGITFERASSSSLTMFHDGAEVTFEDCLWIDNAGSSEQLGSVADVNSSSIVNFFRCEISMEIRNTGATTSSLSLRA